MTNFSILKDKTIKVFFWIYRNLIWICLITALGIILYLFPDLIETYPLKKDLTGKYERDWLSIVSDLGKGLGGAAFILLIFQIFWKNKEEKKERTPALNFKDISLVLPDEFEDLKVRTPHVVCCIETDKNNIPNISHLKGYTKLHSRLNITGPPQKYLKIEIENYNGSHLAVAKELRPKIMILLLEHEHDNRPESFEIELPVNKLLDIPPNKTGMIFINFTINKHLTDKTEIVKVKIIDFNCKNSLNRKVNGKIVGFTSRIAEFAPIIYNANNQPV